MLNPRQPIRSVVQQHAEESAILPNTRSVLVSGPHVKLHHLRRWDDRIAAHLDGLAVAGEFGTRLCEQALETPGVGEAFAVSVRVIEDRDESRLDKLFTLAEAVPEAEQGLISAFGWVSSQHLTGTVAKLLSSPQPFRKRVAIAACAMHRVDPGVPLDAALNSPDAALRARALGTVGELGKAELFPAMRHALEDKDDACRFLSAWSMVLLGDRGSGLGVLTEFCRKPSPFRERALRLALTAMELGAAHDLLKLIARDPKDIRVLIQGAGIAGDPSYVSWLIKQMKDLKLTRLAGESFSRITGLDLAHLNLELRSPENFEAGPTDDPEDPNVDMDLDDSLPWPDSEKIQKWWYEHHNGFQAGVRYFMGKPPGWGHCLDVLKNGYQRERTAAAEYLCLLSPGTPLFNTAAPAWRQQRLLAKMT